ncbi:hypothetical protein [Alkalihalobacillus sp. 1P02AB]|uniref:hypothetical protein n=1 Tax=Alkalihalobacillus sp. 1P02AB TaxID=3132260 RepID=UPI0039A4150F
MNKKIAVMLMGVAAFFYENKRLLMYRTVLTELALLGGNHKKSTPLKIANIKEKEGEHIE